MIGPIAGGPFPAQSPAPRAISEDWWDVVCPDWKIQRIRVDHDGLDGAEVSEVMERYVAALSESTESCVELDSDEPPFDYRQAYLFPYVLAGFLT